jgi:hypothetical protein
MYHGLWKSGVNRYLQLRPVDNPNCVDVYRDLEQEFDSFSLRIADVMAEKPKQITAEEARLRETAVLERLAVLYAEIGRGPGAAPLPVPSKPGLDAASSELANLPLTDAVLEYLKTSKGPKTANQIWAALEAAGFETISETPAHSVVWALKKLAKKNSDVIAVGWGQWDLKSKYTRAKLAKILTKRAGRGGRTTAEHIERTKIGMQTAKASGKQIGARRKLTPEIIDRAKVLLSQGNTIREVAKELGVATSSITGNGLRARALRQEKLEDIAKTAQLRLVK